MLRENLPEGVSIGEVAKRLGVTRQALSALLNGRAGVSAPMALRLEGALHATRLETAVKSRLETRLDVSLEKGQLALRER